LLLMVVAIGGSVVTWNAVEDSRGVLVAARELPAGEVLTAADLTVAHVRLDDALYTAAIPSDGLSSLIGRQLAEPAHANQVLVRAQLSTHPTLTGDQRVYAIPVRPDSAAGGRLQPGDPVEVVGVHGKTDGSAYVVLPRAVVYDVGRQGSSSVGVGLNVSSAADQTPAVWVSLLVTPDEALKLVQAKAAVSST
jgi:Flp pilus assembly protein CpaB